MGGIALKMVVGGLAGQTERTKPADNSDMGMESRRCLSCVAHVLSCKSRRHGGARETLWDVSRGNTSSWGCHGGLFSSSGGTIQVGLRSAELDHTSGPVEKPVCAVDLRPGKKGGLPQLAPCCTTAGRGQ